MASPAGELGKLHEIDLMSLSFQQLNQLKAQLDQELNVFQDSLETLKVAQTKLQESGECLQKLTSETEGSAILVPLSASMYVPGKIADAEHVIVDVGTGYYVKKTIDDGKSYFKRKVDFVTEQIEKIQVMGMEKAKIREAILEVMEFKAQQVNAAKTAVKT